MSHRAHLHSFLPWVASALTLVACGDDGTAGPALDVSGSGGTWAFGGAGGSPALPGSGGTPPSSGGFGSPSSGGSGSPSSGGAPVVNPGSGGGPAGATGSSGGASPSSGGASETGGAASGGASTSGGADGAGGSGPPGSCPSALIGWASVSGDGVTTTTGGGSASPVRPSSAAELEGYASDGTPRVIEIAGTFDIPRLQVASNKTLVGVGKDATINGGLRIRGSEDEPIQNVIVKNLRVNGDTTQVDNDAVQIYFAHHVWLDHMEIWDGRDGNLDMTHAVNWITVSWTKFRYTENYRRPEGESADHRFSSLLGHSDDNSGEDDGRIKVTFHHDWWAERVIERMPRVRFGQVHVFNNYYSSEGNNYCVRAGRGAHLLVEGNYFDGVNSPHQFNDDDDEATANILARNNEYDGTSGEQATGGGGTPFTSPPYAAVIEPAAGVRDAVRACAGPQ